MKQFGSKVFSIILNKQDINVLIELNWLKAGYYSGLWYGNEPSGYM
jgi:hypothetical protein